MTLTYAYNFTINEIGLIFLSLLESYIKFL